MAASTEFLPWATAGGANVASQASFAAGAWRTAGFQTGIAESQQVNKGLRQSLFMSACVATFVAETLDIAVNDDGDLAAAVDNLESALASLARASVYGVFSVAGGTANALTATTTPARPAYVDGELLIVRIATLNTGSATVNRDGLGAKAILRPDGTSVVSADLPAGATVALVYRAANNSFYLIAIPNLLASNGFRFAQQYVASGNFVVPAGVTSIMVECVGGGAGGGGSNNPAAAGGGGGGGGWAMGILAVTPGQVIAMTIGAGGVGGSGLGTDGTNGGTTSFGGVVAATGGQAGIGATGTGGGNGGTGGFIGAGGIGFVGSQGDAGWTQGGGPARAGRGGDAARGGGGGGSPQGTANGYGGGGGGGNSSVGGAGLSGSIIVHW